MVSGFRVRSRSMNWIRQYPNKQRQSTMVPWFALIVSLCALGFSFFQYWNTSLSPYSLLVMPPAISQANDGLPSLVIHLALTNAGGRQAVLTDLVVRGASKGKEVPIILHAQKILDNKMKYSSLPLSDDRAYSVFLPILIRHDESLNLDIYCTPFANQLPLSEASVLAIDGLILDFWINGEEKRAVFMLGYPDYGDKFKGGGRFEIPKDGFSPRWYRNEKPVRIQSTFW
jgi:hypothetical protein